MNERETEKLWEEFVAMMTHVGTFARLVEQCGPYIGRMSNADREYVLEIALGMAWTGIERFNPSRRSLFSYWDSCLAESVRTRMVWRLRYGGLWHQATADEIIEVDYE